MSSSLRSLAAALALVALAATASAAQPFNQGLTGPWPATAITLATQGCSNSGRICTHWGQRRGDGAVICAQWGWAPLCPPKLIPNKWPKVQPHGHRFDMRRSRR